MEKADDLLRRPLWFTFSGSGAHREGAGRDLMKIPTFAATIERAAVPLRPLNVDLVWVLTEAPATVFQDVAISMVSIVALQIGLVDVLRTIELNPDGFFAPSLGELAAAYTDETLTVEQTVLIAYWRGRCMMDAKVPAGPKAKVFMTKYEFEKRIWPPDVEVIAYFTDSVYVACTDSSLKKIIDTLTSEDIPVKTFKTLSMQFHTSYVEAAKPALRKQLESIICNPKAHSSKWISASIPPDKWKSDEGRLINAEFFTNNIRVPPDMATPMHIMPKNAVLVEISAYAKLLIFMTDISSTVTPIELISKDTPASADILMKSICKIYEAMGQKPPIERILAVTELKNITSTT